jgi:hypothetical protein
VNLDGKEHKNDSVYGRTKNRIPEYSHNFVAEGVGGLLNFTTNIFKRWSFIQRNKELKEDVLLLVRNTEIHLTQTDPDTCSVHHLK